MPKSDRFIKVAWWLAAASVVIYCLLSFFYWSLIGVFTPFAAPLLRLPALAAALAAVVTAIILPFHRWHVQRSASLLPLVFLITCFVLTRFIDFTALWLAANFRIHHADRESVVRLISSGELHPNVANNPSLIALPREFAPVSLGGGEVAVQRDDGRLKILFFTFRGVLNKFAGFVYTSDGLAPQNGDFAGQFAITKKVQDQWYYISAH